MKKPKNYTRGQSLVEMTLIFPMLLTLTLGAVELANMIYTYQVMHHLVAQGASMASRITPPTTLDDIINGDRRLVSDHKPRFSGGSDMSAVQRAQMEGYIYANGARYLQARSKALCCH